MPGWARGSCTCGWVEDTQRAAVNAVGRAASVGGGLGAAGCCLDGENKAWLAPATPHVKLESAGL